MSKKKTVKAPLTYDPGKGRPKEHLAYLNWQEMEALKRLNGNNQERGPKGLPSFPPADSRSGAYNSGYGAASRSTPSRTTTTPSRTTTTPSRTTTTSRTSGPSSNLSAPVRTAPSASSYGKTTTTTRSGGTPSAAPRSISGIGSPSRGVTPSYSRGVTTPSAQRTASGVGSSADRSVKQAVESRSISSAQKTPALRQDKAKASGGYKLSDITGTNVPGGKVTGAIQSVRDLGIARVPTGPLRASVPKATVTGYKTVTPTSPGAGGGFGNVTRSQASLTRGSLRTPVGPSSGTTARLDRYGDLAESLSQRRIIQSPTLPSAPQGAFGPRAGVGTGYLRTADMPGMITTGMPSPYSGSADPRFTAESTLRAYEEQKRQPATGKLITDRVPSTGQSVYSGYGTFNAPSISGQGLYKKPGRDPAVERALAEAGYDRTGRPLQRMIDPSIQNRIPLAASSEQAPPPLRWQPGERMLLPGYKEAIKNPSVLRNPVPEAPRPLPPGFGGENPIPTMPSLGEVGRRMADVFSNIGGAVAGAVGSGINALGDVGTSLRPGSVISTDEGLKIVNPDRTLSPYPAERERVINMVRPEYPYQARAGSEVYKLPREKTPPPMPAPSGVESITSPSTIRPPIPRPRPESIRPPIPKPRPENIRITPAGMNLGEGDTVPTEDSVGIGQRPFSNIYSEGLPPQYAKKYGLDKEKVLQVEDFPEYDIPSQQEGPPSQDVTISPKAEEAQGKARKTANAARKGAQILLNLGFLGAGTVAGQGFKYLDAQVQKLVDAYQVSGPTERLAMEKKYPNLIPRAISMGITPQSDYGDYLAWAEKSGLRSPPTKEGGGRDSIGIASLGEGISGGGLPSSGTQPASSGQRPEIYYMWDLGVNIPSPSDPNYTQYQTYLIDRAASQRAMGWA